MRIVGHPGLKKRLREDVRLVSPVTLGEPNDSAAYPLLSALVPEGMARRPIDEERHGR
jgi:hypothetical protein